MLGFFAHVVYPLRWKDGSRSSLVGSCQIDFYQFTLWGSICGLVCYEKISRSSFNYFTCRSSGDTLELPGQTKNFRERRRLA
jgi:hypothetical protein